ncbi:MAG: glycosyltransferase family 2 protein [Tannerellaceae bacterium]|nr:glycosyltransferase family 2 protein [Tannerellaceae bacterium]
MTLPLVSIITPCYNDRKYLLECVESVNKSTYKNVEHIIINDGSTDKLTKNILLNLKHDSVKVFHTPNQGVCKAKNFGVEKSKGKYILFVDGDDLISKTYIEDAVRIFEKSDNLLKVVACNYRLFGKVNRDVFFWKNIHWKN